MIIVPDNTASVPLEELYRVNVVKVFDGDGFLARIWHPQHEAWTKPIAFRFAFIDAPEIEQPFGTESRDFLHGRITGKTLHLDPVGKSSTGGVPIDPYKRVLCMGYLTEQMEGGRINYYLNGASSAGSVRTPRLATRNIELEMAVNGWAWVLEQYSFEREAEYFEAQDDARRNRRGLWAIDNPEPPWKFKRRQKRRTVASDRQPGLL